MKAVNDSHEEYLSVKGRVSASGLKEALKSPRHYLAFQSAPSYESKAMRIGTAVHKSIMENEDFHKEYTYLATEELPNPDKDFRNAENRDFKTAFMGVNKGKTILSEEEWDTVDIMTKNAMSIPMVKKLFTSDFLVEQSYYFDIEELNGVGYNLKGKIRPDYIHNSQPIFLDIKTTTDASPREFLRSYNKFKYQLQMAFYYDMMNKYFDMNIEDCYILAIENKYPYMAQIYRVSDSDIEYGRALYRLGLDRIKHAEESGMYCGYEINAGIEDGEVNNLGVLELETPPLWYLDMPI